MCNCYAVREQYSARNLVEYDTISHTAVVYHIGHHKCHKKLDSKCSTGISKQECKSLLKREELHPWQEKWLLGTLSCKEK